MELLGINVHITRPSNAAGFDLVGLKLKRYPFGLEFIEGVVGFVLCLGWLQVGFRFWPRNATPRNWKSMSEAERESWVDQYVEKRTG